LEDQNRDRISYNGEIQKKLNGIVYNNGREHKEKKMILRKEEKSKHAAQREQ
jgi:hypothetical protein